MRSLSVPMLVVLWVLATVFGLVLFEFVAGRGVPVPITGWVSGLVLLALGAVLLMLGIPLRRYMKESEERQAHPTSAPRRHQIDLPTAYRTIVFARACAYTGVIAGGVYAGQALFLVTSGTGTSASALLPTLFAALSGAALAVLGAVVERWGKLPPSEGEGTTESTPA